MPPTLESQKWTRPSSFSTNPREYVFFTRDCLLARNFLSSSNAAQGATAKNGRTRPDILQFMFNKKTNRSQTGDKGMKTKMLIATLLGCLAWQQGALSQTDTIATNPAATDEVAPANQPAIATDTNQSIGTSTATPPTAPVITATESPSVTTTNETDDASAATPPTAPVVSAPESPSTTTSSVTTSTVTTSNATTDASAATPPTAPVISAPESPSTITTSVTTSTVTTSNAPADTSAATPPTAPVISANESPSVTTTNETTSAAKPQPPGPPSTSIPLIQFQHVPITTAIENLARQAGINYLIDPKIGYGQPDQNGQIKAEPTLSIRWENVTTGQALMALLDNYGLQLSEDRKTQIARITAKDPMALLPLSTHVVQLKWASTSNMVDSVQAVLTDKRSRVIPDTRTSQIIVVATEKEQDAVDELINTLDKPTRQVLIETKLVQIASNPSTKKGIDWSGTLEAQNINFGNGVTDPTRSLSQTLFPGTPTTTTTTAGTPPITTTTTKTHSSSSSTLLATVPQGASKSGGLSLNTVSGFAPGIGFLSADGAHAVLSFLNASADAQVVSTPRVVTLDNQTATISVTRGFPIINVVQSVAGVSSGSSLITYSNIGTTLQVTPRISANDFIWLKVIPDVSSWFDTHSQTIGGQIYPADIFAPRHIETQVLIPNAHTLVMGGLVTDNPNAHYTKVPVLGDIPGLGWAFRSENKTLDKGNLLIFITPTIVQETDFRPTSTDFLKSRPNTVKSPMNPNSIWDGAQPRGDWSNPAPVPGEFDKK